MVCVHAGGPCKYGVCCALTTDSHGFTEVPWSSLRMVCDKQLDVKMWEVLGKLHDHTDLLHTG